MEVVIRRAHSAEIAGLGDVERDGDRRFDGYDGVPGGFTDTQSRARLDRAWEAGRVWVAVGGSAGDDEASDEGGIIGFALAEIVDQNVHLEQVSVRLGHQGQGVGGRLVDVVKAYAEDRGMGAVTLCTFSDVSWNRPFYERRGFVVVPEDQWTPELRAVFEGDGDLGLDLSRRVVMRFGLEAGS
jgi:GNAT superfamily N-acetyltransferase